MHNDTLFSVANSGALLMWILLAIAPGVRWVPRVVTTTAAMVLAVLYVTLIASTPWPEGGGFGSLQQVGTLFDAPRVLLAGWVHYLAFDLLVGSWEVRDAREQGIPHWLVLPCLFGTFMFGPAGWLGYMAIRTVKGMGRASSPASPGVTA